MTKNKDLLVGIGASIIAGTFVQIVIKLSPIEQFAGEFSNLLRVFFVAMMLVFLWKAWRYYEILGGADEPHGSSARDDYDSLRQELAEGGKPTKVYADWLKRFLGWVDKFFGDAGRHDRSWFARMLGLETPGARWTAPAFDKCLLLALIYPLLTIYAVWIWSGEVGVAEDALGLPRLEGEYTGLWRTLFGLGLAAIAYCWWRGLRARDLLPKTLWYAVAGVVVVAFVVAFVVAGAVVIALLGAVVVALAGAVALAVAGAGAFVGAGLFVVAGAGAGAFVGAGAFAGAFAVAGAGAGAFAVAVAVAVGMISEWSIQKGQQGLFLLLFITTFLLANFAGAYFFSPLETWKYAGVFLLMFGVLTLVNAPFDWFAIGLTRALLRRGLVPGGRGPYFYALIDALVAVPLIMLLAFVTIVAVQTFGDIAVLRTGHQEARILPLGPLFERLENTPGDPTVWWVWLMLFSTLIPSICNLFVGAAAFVRGLPFMNTWILSRMPIGNAMRDSERLYVASALAGHLVGGMLISGVLIYLLAAYVVPLGLPAFGAWVRDFSESLAAYNAPAQLMMWLAGSR